MIFSSLHIQSIHVDDERWRCCAYKEAKLQNIKTIFPAEIENYFMLFHKKKSKRLLLHSQHTNNNVNIKFDSCHRQWDVESIVVCCDWDILLMMNFISHGIWMFINVSFDCWWLFGMCLEASLSCECCASLPATTLWFVLSRGLIASLQPSNGLFSHDSGCSTLKMSS